MRRNDEGKMIWYNAGDTPGGEFVVGKIALEDWIEKCQIEYEVVEGLAWKEHSEGNKECASVIQELYDI